MTHRWDTDAHATSILSQTAKTGGNHVALAWISPTESSQHNNTQQHTTTQTSPLANTSYSKCQSLNSETKSSKVWLEETPQEEQTPAVVRTLAAESYNWEHKYSLVPHCDNEAVQCAINTGRSRSHISDLSSMELYFESQNHICLHRVCVWNVKVRRCSQGE